MAYYNVCPVCGSNLDPGERCDCQSIRGKRTGEEQAVFQPDVENRKEQRSDVVCIRTSGRRCDRSMRNKCLFALGLVFAMSLTSIVAFAFSFTGEPDVKNDQQQIVVVNPATGE